jgi:hypothetical protein
LGRITFFDRSPRTVVRVPHSQQAALMGYAELEETVALLGLEKPAR